MARSPRSTATKAPGSRTSALTVPFRRSKAQLGFCAPDLVRRQCAVSASQSSRNSRNASARSLAAAAPANQDETPMPDLRAAVRTRFPSACSNETLILSAFIDERCYHGIPAPAEGLRELRGRRGSVAAPAPSGLQPVRKEAAMKALFRIGKRRPGPSALQPQVGTDLNSALIASTVSGATSFPASPGVTSSRNARGRPARRVRAEGHPESSCRDRREQ